MSVVYSDVVAILDALVGGANTPLGFHGPFWRNKTRDEFVGGPAIYGITPIVVGDSAASGIIAALTGTGAFNSSVGGIGRMPPFGPYLSDEDIGAIADWIDAGCPE